MPAPLLLRTTVNPIPEPALTLAASAVWLIDVVAHRTTTEAEAESEEPVELPAAEIADRDVLVQFDKFKPSIPELLDALRAGTTAEPVAVMNDGSTFAIHGVTRTFWVKIWHSAGTELAKIERVQIISCLPSTRGTNVIIGEE